MSGYKISFKLIKQQTEEMQKVSTQLITLAERVSSASTQLGQDELLEKARLSLTQSASKVGEVAEILGIAGTMLGEIIEEYTGTETKNVSRAEGTKAHSRDFYKNPVAISDAAGEGFAGGVAAGAGVAGKAYAAGVESGTQSTATGATVGAAAAVAGTEAGSAATMAGVDAGSASSMGGVALGAGVAAAGVAAGVGAAFGGIKLSEKMKQKKDKHQPAQTNSDPAQPQYSAENEAAISRAEAALQKAQQELDQI